MRCAGSRCICITNRHMFYCAKNFDCKIPHLTTNKATSPVFQRCLDKQLGGHSTAMGRGEVKSGS